MKKGLAIGIIALLFTTMVTPIVLGNKTNLDIKNDFNYDIDDRYDTVIENCYHTNPISDVEPTYWWDRWPDFPERYEPFFDVNDIKEMGQTAYGMTTADFNDDGVLDFAASWSTVPWTQSTITIFYNNGNDGFSQDDVFSITESEGPYIYDLDSGDFDNDGDIDFLYTYSESVNYVKINGVVSLLLNNGDNSFSDPIMIAWNPPISPNVKRINPQLTSADYDDDEDIDFLIGDNSGRVEFYKNDGTGNFISAGIYDFGGEMSWGLASADFDNDEDIDFIVSQRIDLNTGYIYLVRNDGSDSCFNHSDYIQIAELDPNQNVFYSDPVLTWGCLESIDYNDDGMMDFVFAGCESVFLYMQKEIDVFDYFHILRLPGVADGEGGWYSDNLHAGGISTGDFNDDDLVDMVIGGVQGVIRMCYNNRVLVDIVKPDKALRYVFNEINMRTNLPFIPIYLFIKYGTSIAIGGLTIEAKALEPLQKVEFYLGTRLVYTDDDEPFEWEWTSFCFGRRKVTAVAYDMDGEPAGSDDTIVWKFL